MLEQRKSVRSKEKQRETFSKLTKTPIPYPLALAGVRKRAHRKKVTLGIEGGKCCSDGF